MLKNSWKYAKGYRGTMVLFLIMSITANVVILFEPFFFGKILAVIQENPVDLRRQVVVYLIVLAAIPGVFWIFHGISRVLERITAYRIQVKYDETALQALFGLPVEWHRAHHSGKNIDKFKRASRSLYSFSEEIFSFVEIVVALPGAFVMLILIKPYIGVVACITTVVSFSMVVAFDIFLSKQYRQLNLFYNKIMATAFDYISNVFTVLTMRFSNNAVSEYVRRSFEPFKLYKRNVILNECKWANVTLLVTIMTVGVVAWEILHAISIGQEIVIGTLYTIYAYMDRIGHHFYQFAWRYSQIVEYDAAVFSSENIFHDYERLKNPVTAQPVANWKEIRIKGLHFTYEDEKREKHQIKNIDLEIPRGAKIAFVGESGCGKSTVLGLLRGIYKAGLGDVYIDGEKMKYGIAHLADMTTLMPQDPEIFENTIRYNVAMGVPVPTKKVKEMLKVARFERVLGKLPDGLNTDIAEKGVNLSGGEKQRLALARGLLAGEKSDILLMDEPTSSVDMKNERAIFEEIFRRYKDKTVIASVHRLGLLPMFDMVVYFDGGRRRGAMMPNCPPHHVTTVRQLF